MKQYKLSFYDSANSNLNSIFYFCKEKYGIKYATKVISKIIKDIESLKFFPFSNSLYFISQELSFRKKIVLNRYYIIFSINEDTIYIHNVFDGRRNIKPNNLLKY